MLSVEEAIRFAKERLDSVMRTGSYSLGFAIDLAMMTAQRQYNPFRILEEVAVLEGSDRRCSTTKQAKPFKNRHLRGYWHKHYTQARYMPHNLLNEMLRDGTVERELSPYIGN